MRCPYLCAGGAQQLVGCAARLFQPVPVGELRGHRGGIGCSAEAGLQGFDAGGESRYGALSLLGGTRRLPPLLPQPLDLAICLPHRAVCCGDVGGRGGLRQRDNRLLADRAGVTWQQVRAQGSGQVGALCGLQRLSGPLHVCVRVVALPLDPCQSERALLVLGLGGGEPGLDVGQLRPVIPRLFERAAGWR